MVLNLLILNCRYLFVNINKEDNMNITKLVVSAVLATTMSLSANATLMTIETKAITTTIDSNDLNSSWAAETSSTLTNTVNAFEQYQTGQNSINRFSLEFTTENAATWGFQAGLDAHYGAAIYVNGSLVENRTDDLWWANSWSNSDVITASAIDIVAGNNLLEIYWAEACCNGANSIRFNADGTNWETLTTANITTAIPEPAALALLGFGLLGFSLRRNKKAS